MTHLQFSRKILITMSIMIKKGLLNRCVVVQLWLLAINNCIEKILDLKKKIDCIFTFQNFKCITLMMIKFMEESTQRVHISAKVQHLQYLL